MGQLNKEKNMDLVICITFQGDFMKGYLRMIKKLMGFKWMMHRYT